ncbi:MAG: sigma-70 family RNA polymerase sigma factor [Acidobacteria bacterium]|nr:sigma-70 family RNA polymerase sigma factor [Acidobacteriota bacterium]
MDAGACTMIHGGVMAQDLDLPSGRGPGSRSGEGSLTLRLRAGESLAYEEAVRRFAPRIRALAWRMLGSGEDAEDAAQEVFLRLYRYRRRLDPQRALLPWLYRLTVNVSRTMLKRRRPRRAQPEALPSDTVMNGTARTMEAVDARLTLTAALQRLNPDERAAVVLRDLMGHSTAEVAQALGCREGTIRSRLCRARLKMKDSITGLGEVAP